MPAAVRSGNVNDAKEVVQDFGKDLAKLRELHGSPSFARMSSTIRHMPGVVDSKNTFHRMVADPDRIYGPEFVRGFVPALGLGEMEVNDWNHVGSQHSEPIRKNAKISRERSLGYIALRRGFTERALRGFQLYS